jgi:O-antigen ligase/mannose-6-phosphate isomerase-like protein (cupin superfamily)
MNMDKFIAWYGQGVWFFLIVSVVLLGIGRLEFFSTQTSVSAWSVSRTTFFFWLLWKILIVIRSGRWQMDWLKEVIPLSLIAFVVTVAISLLPDFHNSGDFRYFIFGCAHAVMIMDLFRDQRRSRQLFWLLALLPGLLAFRGILYDPSVLSLDQSFDQTQRLGFPLDHPNTAGYIFSMSFPLGMAVVVSEKGFWRGLGLLSCGAQLLGLILTYSRGAWLGWTAAMIFVMAAWRKWKAASCILVGLLLAFALVEPLRDRLLTLTRPQTDISLNDRMRIMKGAVELGYENPVLGIGYGRGRLKQALRHVYEGTADENSPIWHAHNVYIELFAETGVLGLGAFVALLGGTLFVVLRRAYTAHGPDVSLLLGLAAAWIAAATTGLGDIPFYHHETRIFFFSILALGFVFDRVRNLDGQPNTVSPTRRICYHHRRFNMAEQTHRGRIVDKPWGHELIWAHTDRYVGKVLHIKRGESLSYQYHRVKDETIRLLSGAMDMDLERDGVKSRIALKPGDCLHIVPGMKHRMVAVEDCDVLEVSTPELDDVVRLEDRYGRVDPKK